MIVKLKATVRNIRYTHFENQPQLMIDSQIVDNYDLIENRFQCGRKKMKKQITMLFVFVNISSMKKFVKRYFLVFLRQ